MYVAFRLLSRASLGRRCVGGFPTSSSNQSHLGKEGTHIQMELDQGLNLIKMINSARVFTYLGSMYIHTVVSRLSLTFMYVCNYLPSLGSLTT